MSNNTPHIITESSSKSSFLAGLEESFARLISFFITLLFFVIYTIAGGNSLSLNWTALLGFLALFWFLYEFISFLLFVAFSFFSRLSEPKHTEEAEQNDTKEIQGEENLDKNTESVEEI